jgi:ribose 5-phosphate isomerase B
VKISFSNDHAAVAVRDSLLAKMRSLGHEVVDFGARTSESVDYADSAAPALDSLAKGEVDRAVLVCGSGIGMSIVANRVPGVRCALVTDLFAAEMSRLHNDANCLALRAREQDSSINEQIIEKWLATGFEGGRHTRRVEKIEEVSRGVTGRIDNGGNTCDGSTF